MYPFHAKFHEDEVFFCTDWHNLHLNLCRGTTTWSAGFRNFDTLEQMEDAIVQGVNEVVPEDAHLFNLGDIIFNKDKPYNLRRFLSRIKCKNIHLVYGNHDDWLRRDEHSRRLFASIQDYLEIFVNKKIIVMSHYPMEVWRENNRGSWMLHGHSHRNLKDREDMKRLDLFTDRYMKPFSYKDLKEIMDKKTFIAKDHHK